MLKIDTVTKITKPIQFALEKLENAIRDKGQGRGYVLRLSKLELLEEQCYRIVYNNDEIIIEAGSDSGFMYAVLYVANCISHKGDMDSFVEKNASPYMKKRGIKFNIPLDARTPSYSDASDSASLNIVNMWDFSFWEEFLDRMACNNYNVLSLWTLSPFPSLVRIPEYPKTALEDVKRTTKYFHATTEGNNMYTSDMYESLVTVKKMTMDEKTDFWRRVMQYAKDRCIDVFLFTWNVFVYGTEKSGYDIDSNQDNPVTRDYFYCGVKALMGTYPLLAGIGVTTGENMRMDDSDIDFIKETYGRGITDYLSEHPDRKFRFIHRMQMTRYDSIVNAFTEFACPFEISFKYSQAHMYSCTTPSFINTFLEEKKESIKIWLTVRNDDFYMYRWGDPEYAREYIRNMPTDTMAGFYMGSDGYTWGRDYMDLRDFSHPQYIEKMWYMFMIWGQLSYHIDLPEEYFLEELNSYFSKECSLVYKIWKNASAILPVLNCAHWHDYDFQWYPEGCCMYHKPPEDKIVFADINEFMECGSAPGSNYYSIKEYCEHKIAGKPESKKTPFQAAEDIWNNSLLVQDNLAELRHLAGKNNELSYTIDDMEALSLLGFYYSLKLKAATYLVLYKRCHDSDNKAEAVKLLKEATLYWKKYSGKSVTMYKPQVLTRLCGYVDVSRFDELTELDISLAEEM